MMLHEQMLDEIVCHKLQILAKAADLAPWRKLVHALEHPEHEVDIAFVGKYVDLQDSYKSLNEALRHAGIHTNSKVNIHYLDSEELEKGASPVPLEKMDAILVPGRLRQARHRRQDEGDPLRARERRPVSRHLPRHAARDHRVRAQRRAASPAPTAPSSTARRRTRWSR